MRPLLVSTYDIHGGAARASLRLLRGLRGRLFVDAELAVKVKSGEDTGVNIIPQKGWSFIEKRLFQLSQLFTFRKNYVKPLPAGFSKPAEDFFSADLATYCTSYRPDVVHLHWVCNDFLSLQDLARLNKPLIWTLHDSWPFTGGCHVPGGCEGYLHECGCCPILRSNKKNDLSQLVLAEKKQVFRDINLTLVAPSHWLADCVRSSSLLGDFPVEVIPNGLDVEIFRPLHQSFSRQALGLEPGGPIILFGGMGSTSDFNKGFHLLQKAMEGLQTKEMTTRPQVVIFGANEGPMVSNSVFSVRYLGFLRDDISLALAYSAADVMVVPSIQEAFGQTALEAMACGTPVVCFKTSGLLDIVDHQLNGYLAEPYRSEDLLGGILWVLSDNRAKDLGEKAREKCLQSFSSETVGSQYLSLYERVCKERV